MYSPAVRTAGLVCANAFFMLPSIGFTFTLQNKQHEISVHVNTSIASQIKNGGLNMMLLLLEAESLDGIGQPHERF